MEHLQKSPRAQNIFSHAMKQHYCSPPNTEFDIRFNDPAVTDQNIKRIADALVAYFKDFRSHYQQDVVLHPIGCDFTFSTAGDIFKSWDKLINYINGEKSYETQLSYSTPSAYVSEVHGLNLNYTTKTDDFLPYSNDNESFWTGFFTSRPVFKEQVRATGRFVHWSRNLISNWGLTNERGEYYQNLIQELVFN